ncbi:MAG TPA: hypothetical protein VNO22_02765 [Planctomycetota bacterium]|nr:hypothetical protein [Planctomycetota bacterium]
MTNNRHARIRGSALLTSTIVVVLVVGLGGAFLSLTLFRTRAQHAALQADEALLICEAGFERARRALLHWRNANPDAWNDALAYCRQLEEELSGQAPGPGSGALSEGGLSPINPWRLTRLSHVRQEYFEDLQRDPAFRSYSPDSTDNTLIPSDFREFLAVNIPFGKGAYHVVMIDNDDEHGDGMDEDGDGDRWEVENPEDAGQAQRDPAIDGDRTVHVTVTATLRDGTQRQITATVEYPRKDPEPPGAVLSNGSINLQGAFKIRGAKGLVHSNENVTGNGSAQAEVSQSVTASGTASITMSNPPPGGIRSNQPALPIDRVNVTDYISAEYEYRDWVVILGRDGRFYRVDAAGNRVAATDATYPFTGSVDGTTGRYTWTISGGASVPPRIYYVEGDFKMTGAGSSSPYEMTLIVDGHVHLGGNSKFVPWKKPDGNSSNTLLVANGDVRLRGTGSAGTVQYQGVVLANEQIEARGNYTLQGALLAVNATDTPGSLVSTGSIVEPDLTVGGSVQIEYDGKTTILPPPARSLIVRGVRRAH